MAIPPEFRTFKDEADFTARWIIPLLHRLGFSVVVHYHGRREFGRDVVFGEIDRFGHVVYYAMQVKFVASVSQSDSHDLIADAKESFGHEFNHPQKKTSERVCRFYAANAGSIATNARDNFFALLETQLSVNSALLDGRALLALDRSATLNRDSLAKESLCGLLIELRVNRTNKLEHGLNAFLENGPYPMQRFRLAATSAMLERPIILDGNFIQHLQDYWHFGRSINQIVDSMDTFLHVPDLVAERARTGIQTIPKFEQLADKLENTLREYLTSLGVVSI